MKDHVWKPTNPKFQLIWTFFWRVIKITLGMCQVKISNFHFGDISSFSPPYLNESFIAISQKIENFFLYRTVYKDIFLIIPQTTNSPYTGRKIEPNNSISIKRLSGKVKAIFFDSRFWKSIKNWIEWYIQYPYNSLTWHLIFRRNYIVCVGH
jgi:hypothetical protein